MPPCRGCAVAPPGLPGGPPPSFRRRPESRTPVNPEVPNPPISSPTIRHWPRRLRRQRTTGVLDSGLRRNDGCSAPPAVIPAKAGIHPPGLAAGWNPPGFWIPACAGMTDLVPPPTVIPAQAGIHTSGLAAFRNTPGFWIPACAGMTDVTPPPTVIPAQAGIHPRPCRRLESAGVLDSALRRNDGCSAAPNRPSALGSGGRRAIFALFGFCCAGNGAGYGLVWWRGRRAGGFRRRAAVASAGVLGYTAGRAARDGLRNSGPPKTRG